MKTVASFGFVLAATLTVFCHCTSIGTSTTSSDCSGTAPTMQCDFCGTTVSQTAVCIDNQWSCEPSASCTSVGTQTCGAEQCDPTDAYCAAKLDGGVGCTPYPIACHQSGPGCGCIGFDASTCWCSAGDAGIVVVCEDDPGDAGADAAQDAPATD